MTPFRTRPLAGVSWRFNAWGGKSAYAQDASLARRILDGLGLECFGVPLANEGGAIHVDGEGTLITTESVLLNANRNPGLSKAEIEALFARLLGVTRTIWLPGDPDRVRRHDRWPCRRRLCLRPARRVVAGRHPRHHLRLRRGGAEVAPWSWRSTPAVGVSS